MGLHLKKFIVKKNTILYNLIKINILKTMKKITEIDKLVGANIKLKRLMLGLTLDEMSTNLGISKQQLVKYEGGLNRVSAGSLFIFSEILKVPIDYFYNQLGESKMLLGECKKLQSLVKSFCEIKSPEERRNIIKLTKKMAKEVV
jgi:transcriptional regulator with XRE-family HTH domain